MSLRNKLDRLRPHLSFDEKKQISPQVHAEDEGTGANQSIPFQKEWEEHDTRPYYFDGDYCLVREKSYPLEKEYGRYRFSQFTDAVQAWNQTSFSHPLSAKGFVPEDLFFFDTETTGLGGGTGNTIFLLGQASVKDNQIVVKQHILPQPGAEVPLYQSFLENVDYSTLVTYNGKAFDWPQVKTRHTLIREHVPRLPSFGHFDLFHAARRLWSHKLDRLKLSIVEKEVLGIEREDDVPGFLAPMIYFDFVENQNPAGMLGILKHNEMDILSLITLYTHLTFQLLSIDKKQTITETYEVGRWYSYLGDTGAAMKAFSQIASGSELDAMKAKLALSYEYKKQKEWEKATALWKELDESGHPTLAIESCIELAKFYEHKKKDIKSALYYSERAKQYLDKRKSMFRLNETKDMQEVNKRLERLRKKLTKSI